MSIDLEQFHEVFFEESFEGLDIMENGLMGLDAGAADVEEINTIFRAAHSIKGGSGTFGFSEIAEFTHVMETLLDEMRDSRREVTREAVDVLLRSVDVLRMMLNSAQDKTDIDQQQIEQQLQQLETLLGVSPGGALAEATSDNEETGKAVGWHIVFEPEAEMMKTGNDPLRIIRELDELGDMHVTTRLDNLPGLDELNPEDCYLAWDIVLRGDVDENIIRDIFLWVEDECKLELKPIFDEKPETTLKSSSGNQATASDEPKAETAKPTAPVAAKPKAAEAKTKASTQTSNSIRVGIDKIDGLINMVGELVITQSMLSLLGEEFSIEKLERLQDGLGQLERHTRELQESVMKIRMLPISFSFNRFPRLVRDLSAALGKKIDLVMSGENTEIDKTLIEKIGDPLVHLVRNSIDHGIEMPEERIDAGKPETGTIHLTAYHKGGNIIIEIHDDGKGIDADVIYNKGVEKGLIKANAKLTKQQVFDLIFQPGFSTAKEVSDISGRGVGMDVVRRNILSLGGAVDIQSELGAGSTFTIRLPLTLAILDGQTVRVWVTICISCR